VKVLQFCRLSWCSASRGFVSDSWATCAESGRVATWIFVQYLCVRLALCTCKRTLDSY